MSLWSRLADEASDLRDRTRDLPVSPRVTAAEIRDHLATRYPFDAPLALDDVVHDAARMLRAWNVHVTHPRYFGLFNPGVREAAVMADFLTALYNPQLAAWSHAPAANEIERHTLARLAPFIGMPPAGLHSFASGGAEANLCAVLAALAHRFPAWSEDGAAALPGPAVLYVTAESHHSFVKIARMTGLGTAAVREVPVGDDLAMDPAALERAIDEDRQRGRVPLLIVGTAGTTAAGVIDPLAAIADVAAASGAWLHVDGAWGAAAALSPRLRPLLAGIERADSVTWDAHKWLSVPMGAGMFFCRHPLAVREAFSVAASYMPDASGEEAADSYATTPQWSRRFIGLKLFMALAELGFDGYAALIEHQADMGDLLRRRLAETGWRVVNASRLPVVCFTHPDIEAGRLAAADVLRTIYERRRVWISEARLTGSRQPVLRACITSYETTPADVACLLEELAVALER